MDSDLYIIFEMYYSMPEAKSNHLIKICCGDNEM